MVLDLAIMGLSVMARLVLGNATHAILASRSAKERSRAMAAQVRRSPRVLTRGHLSAPVSYTSNVPVKNVIFGTPPLPRQLAAPGVRPLPPLASHPSVSTVTCGAAFVSGDGMAAAGVGHSLVTVCGGLHRAL